MQERKSGRRPMPWVQRAKVSLSLNFLPTREHPPRSNTKPLRHGPSLTAGVTGCLSAGLMGRGHVGRGRPVWAQCYELLGTEVGPASPTSKCPGCPHLGWHRAPELGHQGLQGPLALGPSPQLPCSGRAVGPAHRSGASASTTPWRYRIV